MPRWQRCPICEGQGTVPVGHVLTRDTNAVDPMQHKTCWICQGRGIIQEAKSPEDVPVVAKSSSDVSLTIKTHTDNQYWTIGADTDDLNLLVISHYEAESDGKITELSQIILTRDEALKIVDAILYLCRPGFANIE